MSVVEIGTCHYKYIPESIFIYLQLNILFLLHLQYLQFYQIMINNYIYFFSPKEIGSINF